MRQKALKPLLKPLSLRLPADLQARFEEEAEKNNLSLNTYLRLFITIADKELGGFSLEPRTARTAARGSFNS